MEGTRKKGEIVRREEKGWEGKWKGLLGITSVALVLLLFCCSVVGVGAEEGMMSPEVDFDSSSGIISDETAGLDEHNMNETTADTAIEGNGTGGGGAETPSGEEGSLGGFVPGFIASISVIVVSELGDKTFFIAAIMAMRHSRLVVFFGAISALALMTLLSALLGYATTVIPKEITFYASTALFAFFGLKMLYDGFRMSPEEGAQELEEVEQTLRRQEDNDKEETPAPAGPEQADQDQDQLPTVTPVRVRSMRFAKFFRIFLQALTMTFLAEWGDRSQIATIILAARENVAGVCIGGILGHAMCTGLAVVGGRMLAQKMSVRAMTFVGGAVFLFFAVTSVFIGPD